MLKLNRVCAVLPATVFCCLLAPAASIAQGLPDRDTREISSYVLTEAGVAKYSRASANLGDLSRQVMGGCDDDGEDATSLDASVARINAVPGAQAAIQSAGMTTREYLVFTWSMFQSGMAAWAVSQPGGKLPPGVSKANVDFYRAHEQALQQLGPQQGSDSCNDRDEDETYPEEAEEPAE